MNALQVYFLRGGRLCYLWVSGCEKSRLCGFSIPQCLVVLAKQFESLLLAVFPVVVSLGIMLDLLNLRLKVLFRVDVGVVIELVLSIAILVLLKSPDHFVNNILPALVPKLVSIPLILLRLCLC